MDVVFVPRIAIRRGENRYWRGYTLNWRLLQNPKGFLVHPTSPAEVAESKELLKLLPVALRPNHPSPLDAAIYEELSIIEGVTIFNVSPSKLSAECHEPFPGWEVIEPKIIAAMKQTLTQADQERLIIEVS